MLRKLAILLFAAAVFGHGGGARAATSESATCPQASAPFMVEGNGANATLVAPSQLQESAQAQAPAGAFSPDSTSCVAPTLNYFYASPNPVYYGNGATVYWSASSPYPLACNVSSPLGGANGEASGSWATGPVTSFTTFTLYCVDGYGSGNTWSTTLSVDGGGGGSGGNTSPAGWLDRLTADDGVVGGWACDGDDWNAEINVHIYADGSLVATTPASVYRSDLVSAGWPCAGTGNHGFTYQLPDRLRDGVQHQVQAVADDINGSRDVVGAWELSGSPAYQTFTSAAPQVTEFSASPQSIWGGSSATLKWSSSGSASCQIASNQSGGGSWSGLPGSGTLATPALTATKSYVYTLTCSNQSGSASAQAATAAFSTSEDATGAVTNGDANAAPPRGLATVNGCKWKGSTNEEAISLPAGLTAGGLRVYVYYCVKGGQIWGLRRSDYIEPPNYPFSYWIFDKIVSYGPCSADCMDFNAFPITKLNVYEEGRWSICQPLLPGISVCIRDKYLTVGETVKGDGTHVAITG